MNSFRDALRWGPITTAERVCSGWTLSVVLGGLLVVPLVRTAVADWRAVTGGRQLGVGSDSAEAA